MSPALGASFIGFFCCVLSLLMSIGSGSMGISDPTQGQIAGIFIVFLFLAGFGYMLAAAFMSFS
jgi:hypothetical protein